MYKLIFVALVFSVLLLVSVAVRAQGVDSSRRGLDTAHSMVDTGRNMVDTGRGVVVVKDPRIDQLVRKQIEINELTTRESRRFVPGFRIQVINSPDRSKVFAAKAKVYAEFPDWKPYLLYQSPNYKLRVGDFKTQEEAQDALKQLSRIFAQELYVIPDVIELKLSDLPKADTTITNP